MSKMEQTLVSRTSDALSTASSLSTTSSLERSLLRLREVSTQFERQSMSDVPTVFRPFLELVKTQAAVIEALFQTQNQNRTLISASADSREDDFQPIVQQETIRRELSIKPNPRTEWKMVEERTRTLHRPRRRQPRSMSETSVDIANIYFKIEETNHTMQQGSDTSDMQRQQRVEEVLEPIHPTYDQTRTFQTESISHPKPQHPPSRAKRPSVLSVVIPKTITVPLVSPLTPDERSWFLDPTPPTAGLSRHPSWRVVRHAPSLEHFSDSQNNSLLNSNPLESKASHSSCLSCNGQSWLLSDSNAEAHVQEAITSLISSMKEKKRVPVGPLVGSAYQLYSAKYRDYHCVHQDSSRQRLTVFESAADWASVVPEISPPLENEIAMQLMIDPGCRMVILPFKPPKHAGWKWHELDGLVLNPWNNDETCVNDDKKRKIEVMFIGNGFLKLRVRLGDLLDSNKGCATLSERFMEFAGIWQSASKASHHLRSQQLMTRLVLKDSPRSFDSGFHSAGSLRSSRVDSTGDEVRNEKASDCVAKPHLDFLSPVSPL